MGTRPILQVLKRFQVFFPVPVQVQCERFLLKPYNPFFQVPVPVPVPVPDQASVNTPSIGESPNLNQWEISAEYKDPSPSWDPNLDPAMSISHNAKAKILFDHRCRYIRIF